MNRQDNIYKMGKNLLAPAHVKKCMYDSNDMIFTDVEPKLEI